MDKDEMQADDLLLEKFCLQWVTALRFIQEVEQELDIIFSPDDVVALLIAFCQTHG